MIKDKNKSTGFVDFLNKEFRNKKSVPVVAQVVKKQEAKKVKRTVLEKAEIVQNKKSKKVENAFAKKSNVKNRLANASKLIKTMEVFLDGKSEEMNVNYETFQGWDEIYRDMKINIQKDVDDLIQKRRNQKTKKTFFAILDQKLEYAPQGNFLNYSVVVMSVLMLSFFSTVIFPDFANKSISKIDSLFVYPINKIVKMQNMSMEEDAGVAAVEKPQVTKAQLAEYIKKNFDRIKNNQTVPVEDITGQVAGVEE